VRPRRPSWWPTDRASWADHPLDIYGATCAAVLRLALRPAIIQLSSFTGPALEQVLSSLTEFLTVRSPDA